MKPSRGSVLDQQCWSCVCLRPAGDPIRTQRAIYSCSSSVTAVFRYTHTLYSDIHMHKTLGNLGPVDVLGVVVLNNLSQHACILFPCFCRWWKQEKALNATSFCLCFPTTLHFCLHLFFITVKILNKYLKNFYLPLMININNVN